MTRAEALKVAKPILLNMDMVRAILDGKKTVTRRIIKNQHQWNLDTLTDIGACLEPPYQIGNILYVRETWGFDKDNWLYKADFSDVDLEKLKNIMRWHPSIHMPKEATRIFLRVTSVRVERLQDITAEQIMREGIYKAVNPFAGVDNYVYESEPKRWFSNQLNCFRYGLWNSTVKKSDLNKYGWEADPYVWVIEFEKIEVE